MQFFYCLNSSEIEQENEIKYVTTTTRDSNLNLRYVEYKSCEIDCEGWFAFSRCQFVRVIQSSGKPAKIEIPEIEDDFSSREIVDWKEIDDYPDWYEAELNGVNLTDDEFKIILQAAKIDESETENKCVIADFVQI